MEVQNIMNTSTYQWDFEDHYMQYKQIITKQMYTRLCKKNEKFGQYNKRGIHDPSRPLHLQQS